MNSHDEAIRTELNRLIQRYGTIIKVQLRAGDLTPDAVDPILLSFARQIEWIARYDELDRIQHDTLDSDLDVWSHDNTGTIMLVADRVKGLHDDVLKRP